VTAASGKDGPNLSAQIRDICAGTLRLSEELRRIGPDSLRDRIQGKIFDWGGEKATIVDTRDVAKRHKAYLAGVARKKLEDRFTVSLFSHVEK
jgi:hypothetical protein